jgi:hydroxypyruvate reductase
LQIVGQLGPDDACIALISGGGSALTPAPIEGISLADKLAVTQFLSAAGADITELNTVRKQLSRFKGGGLARQCNAGRLVSLIISDVIGDPLDLIASGPTVADPSTPQDALDILARYDAHPPEISTAVFSTLQRLRDEVHEILTLPRPVTNLLIGNNDTAVQAAAAEAERLGYNTYTISAAEPDGPAEEMGRKLALYAALPKKVAWPARLCYVGGGECTVKLAPAEQRGLGGRNQQTVLAALIELQQRGSQRFVVLSGGTDGEDGPTDAAGALVDTEVIAEAQRRGLDAADSLQRNDAYRFFEPLGALMKTGPTHTNVCDVRVVLVDR